MKILRLLFCALLLFPGACFAQVISSSDLIEHAKDYDGKTVIYEGEVIGDIMVRRGFVWMNVSDGANAIGIWSPADLSAGITYAGNYKHTGDRIKVSGVFHRACPEHGGDLDIHAESIRKVSEGRVLTETLNPDKRNLVLILLGVLCLVLVLMRLKPGSKRS